MEGKAVMVVVSKDAWIYEIKKTLRGTQNKKHHPPLPGIGTTTIQICRSVSSTFNEIVQVVNENVSIRSC